MQRIEPYNVSKINGRQEQISNSGGNLSVLTENTTKPSLGRLSVSQSSDPVVKETKSLARLSVSQNSEPTNKDSKTFSCMPFPNLLHVNYYGTVIHLPCNTYDTVFILCT